MKEQHTTRHGFALLLAMLVVGFGVASSCSLFQPDPETVRQHPWVAQPVSQETKKFFCTRLGLPPSHDVCRADEEVLTKDLLPVLQQKFPVGRTSYSEVADVLQGYPFETEKTTSPDGTLVSLRYSYLLTEFDGFCVEFEVRDPQSGMISRIYSSNPSGSGPTSDTCTSTEVREATRAWLLKPTPPTPTTLVP